MLCHPSPRLSRATSALLRASHHPFGGHSVRCEPKAWQNEFVASEVCQQSVTGKTQKATIPDHPKRSASEAA